MVLDAIARGIQDPNKIAKVLKINKEEVELIVNDLLTQRLIIKKENRGFFGNKKIKISITDTGIKLLNSKKEELERKWHQAQKMYNNGKGNKAQLQTYMETNRSWVPLMIFSGIIDVLFFMTMMSFLGMALNPMEQSMEQKMLEEVNQAPKSQAVVEQILEIPEILVDLMQADLEIFDSQNYFILQNINSLFN
jgi:predicted transcriptional regulator